MLKIGHRGACGYGPENTLRSFQKAILLGADMVECDVHLSKDNHVVVIHDFKVNRTTNGRGKVSKMTLAELKLLDAGKSEKIPTLEELIDLVKGKCLLNVEIKGWKPAQKVAEIIQAKNFAKYTVISSSNYKALQILSSSPAQELALIVFRPIRKNILLNKITKAGINAVHIDKRLASKKIISFFHEHNIKVRVWTVNKPSQINKFKRLKVDGIISNYPDRI